MKDKNGKWSITDTQMNLYHTPDVKLTVPVHQTFHRNVTFLMGFLYNKICIGFVICAIKWHNKFGPRRFGNNDSHLLYLQYSRVPKIFLCPFLVNEQWESSSQHKIVCWSCVWFSYVKSTDYPIKLLAPGLTASNWKKKSSGLLSTASVSAFTSTIGLSNWALSREAWAWFWPSASTGIRNWARLDSSVTWSQITLSYVPVKVLLWVVNLKE